MILPIYIFYFFLFFSFLFFFLFCRCTIGLQKEYTFLNEYLNVYSNLFLFYSMEEKNIYISLWAFEIFNMKIKHNNFTACGAVVGFFLKKRKHTHTHRFHYIHRCFKWMRRVRHVADIQILILWDKPELLCCGVIMENNAGISTPLLERIHLGRSQKCTHNTSRPLLHCH